MSVQEIASLCEYASLEEKDSEEVLKQYQRIQEDSQLKTQLTELVKRLTKIDNSKKASELPVSHYEEKDLSCFHLIACLQSVPYMVEGHQKLKIPDRISRLCASDLATKVKEYKAIYSRTGFNCLYWFSRFIEGDIYPVGRFQYEILPLQMTLCKDKDELRYYKNEDEIPDGVERLLSPGAKGLCLHIPSTGPLIPELVKESLKGAPDFFKQYFPEYQPQFYYSVSWLFHPALIGLLDEKSNLSAFLSQFELVPIHNADDSDVGNRVFNCIGEEWKQMTPVNSLQKAVLKRVNEGKNWEYYGMYKSL